MSTIPNVETKIVEVEAKIVEVEAEIMKVKAELTTCSESEKDRLYKREVQLRENLNLLRKEKEQLRDKEKFLLESTLRTTGIFPR